MAHGPAELLQGDVLAGDRLHHVGAGDEHVAGAVDHEDEVGHGRRVDGAAGARAHDHADLGDDARGLHVAVEDPAVGVERDHALLDAGPGAVVQADHGDADRLGQVHDLVDLLGEDLAEGAAEDGEVLAEDADPPAVDGAEAGDDTVGVGPVLLEAHAVGPVAGEHVELLERALVEQVLDPLPGRHLALGVLALDGAGRAGVQGLLLAGLQLGQALRHRVFHGRRGYPSLDGTLKPAWPALLLDQLDEGAEAAFGVHEGHRRAPRSRPGDLVDDLAAAVLHRLERRRAVGHPVADVVEALALVLQELGHRRVVAGGREQLDVGVGHLDQRLFDPVGLDPLPVGDLGTEGLAVVGRWRRRGRGRRWRRGRSRSERTPGSRHAPCLRNKVIRSSPTLARELGVVDAEALLGGQAEDADLALVQVVVDLVGGLAHLVERVDGRQGGHDLALADELVGVPGLAVVGEVGALDGLELHPEVAVVVLDHVAGGGRAGDDGAGPLAREDRGAHGLAAGCSNTMSGSSPTRARMSLPKRRHSDSSWVCSSFQNR